MQADVHDSTKKCHCLAGAGAILKEYKATFCMLGCLYLLKQVCALCRRVASACFMTIIAHQIKLEQGSNKCTVNERISRYLWNVIARQAVRIKLTLYLDNNRSMIIYNV